MATKKRTLLQKLAKNFACQGARAWLRNFKTPAGAWEQCSDPLWMCAALSIFGLTTVRKQQARRRWNDKHSHLRLTEAFYEGGADHYRKLYGNPFKDRKVLSRLRRLV